MASYQDLIPRPGSFTRDPSPLISLRLLDEIDPESIVFIINERTFGPADNQVELKNNTLLIRLSSDNFIQDGSNSVSISFTTKLGEHITVSTSFIIDRSDPIISLISPLHGANNIGLYEPIEFEITDLVSGIEPSSILLKINNNTYKIRNKELALTGNRLKYTPTAPFKKEGQNTVFLSVKDRAGNAANSNIGTRELLRLGVDTEGPVITRIDPPSSYCLTNNAYKPIVASIIDYGSGLDESSIVLHVDSVEYNMDDPEMVFAGDTLTFTPVEPYTESRRIRITISATDLAENTTTLTSVLEVDQNPMAVVSTTPADDALLTSVLSEIQIEFLKPIDPTSIVPFSDVVTVSRQALNNPGGPFVPVSTALGLSHIDRNNDKLLHIVPDTQLARNYTYRIVIASSIRDIAGNSMLRSYTLEFRSYLPGDISLDGVLTELDALKYAKCARYLPVTSELNVAKDLNMDGRISNADVVLLLGVISSRLPLSNIQSDALDIQILTQSQEPDTGSLTSIQIQDLDSESLGNRVSTYLTFNGAVDISAFQLKIQYDTDYLALVDVTWLKQTDYRETYLIEKGNLFVSGIDLSGTRLIDNILKLEFVVTATDTLYTETTVDIVDPEVSSTNEWKQEGFTTISGHFFPSATELVVSAINVTCSTEVVSTQNPQAVLSAQLVDDYGFDVAIESLSVDWTVIVGDGQFIPLDSVTNPSGKATVTYLPMPLPNSTHQVRASVTITGMGTIYGDYTFTVIPDAQLTDIQVTLSKTDIEIGGSATIEVTANIAAEGPPVRQDITHLTNLSIVGDSIGYIQDTTLIIATEGTAVIRAELATDPEQYGESDTISAFPLISFTDCNDTPLPVDSSYGYQTVNMGKIHSGHSSGIQEIRLHNQLKKYTNSVAGDILIASYNPGITPLTCSTTFFPIDTATLVVRKTSGGTNKYLAHTRTDIDREPLAAISFAEAVDNIYKIELPYVNVQNVAFLCSGVSSYIDPIMSPFKRQYDSIDDLTTLGDFYVDTVNGDIYLYTTRSFATPGFVSYSAIASIVVENEETGSLRISVSASMLSGDSIVADYEYSTGTLSSVEITVTEDPPSSSTSISSDGQNFSTSIVLPCIPGEDFKRIFVQTDVSGPSGGRHGQIQVRCVQIVMNEDE